MPGEVQITPAHLRVVAAVGPTPDRQLISAEPTEENDKARRVAERLAAKSEAAWRAIQSGFDGLPSLRRGALVAFWSDVEGVPIDDIAARFGYRPNTISVNKSRALGLHDPCVPDVSTCTRGSHCAHVEGERIFNTIAADSAATILREVYDELGAE
jgi:hypothetical protein